MVSATLRLSHGDYPADFMVGFAGESNEHRQHLANKHSRRNPRSNHAAHVRDARLLLIHVNEHGSIYSSVHHSIRRHVSGLGQTLGLHEQSVKHSSVKVSYNPIKSIGSKRSSNLSSSNRCNCSVCVRTHHRKQLRMVQHTWSICHSILDKRWIIVVLHSTDIACNKNG